MSDNFVHLHVHDDHSVLDGINRVEKLPEHAKSLGQVALAQTNHGTMSGSYKFVQSARKAGVKPICGLEAYYTVGDRTAKEKDEDGSNYYHLILLAKNQNGLKNLFRLSSESFISGFYHKPRIDDALLADFSDDLYATSSCLGSRSSQLILSGRKREAVNLLEHHAEIFKDRFFLEVQTHGDAEQHMVNQVLVQLSAKRGWPLVLTGDCHYQDYDDTELHAQALCMQTNQKMSDENRLWFETTHFAHHDFMAAEAAKHGIPYEALSNTKYLADMIDAHTYYSDIRNRFPKYPGLPEGLTSDEALARLAKKKLMQIFDGKLPPQEYQDRINHELVSIKKAGFSDYMLIQWEIITQAESMGCLVGPGRGSSAGSLVAFALGITKVDPIKYDLLFERFLNPGRSGAPLIFTDEMKTIANHYIGAELDAAHTH